MMQFKGRRALAHLKKKLSRDQNKSRAALSFSEVETLISKRLSEIEQGGV